MVIVARENVRDVSIRVLMTQSDHRPRHTGAPADNLLPLAPCGSIPVAQGASPPLPTHETTPHSTHPCAVGRASSLFTSVLSCRDTDAGISTTVSMWCEWSFGYMEETYHD